jgi:hypothetical protein
MFPSFKRLFILSCLASLLNSLAACSFGNHAGGAGTSLTGVRVTLGCLSIRRLPDSTFKAFGFLGRGMVYSPKSLKRACNYLVTRAVYSVRSFYFESTPSPLMDSEQNGLWCFSPCLISSLNHHLPVV